MSEFTPLSLSLSLWFSTPLNELSIKYNVTPSKVALNWQIQYKGDTVVAIRDATKEILVKENCGSMSFSLSDEDMTRLDNLSAISK